MGDHTCTNHKILGQLLRHQAENEAAIRKIVTRVQMAIDDDTDQWLSHRERLEELIEEHATAIARAQEGT